MTAIAGLWHFDGRPDARDDLERMLKSQALYGPHHSAGWSDDSVALGRRLFRILPEDAQDRGPVVGASGQILVGDVRLDNRDELLRALDIAQPGRALCDAAILLAAIERWDDAALDRLQGDFAFAVWDPRRRRLLLARDFLGQRPLHYHCGERFFAFASMPKGLHALPDVPYGADAARAAEFLTLIPETGSRSFFAGIACVPAGHLAVVTDRGVAVRRWWEPARHTLSLGSDADYEEGLRHHLDEAVRVRLRGAEGRVGAHLSAGFDSAAVAATAARLMAPQGGHVAAFTAVPRPGYDGPVPRNRIGDEGPLAAATAAMHPNIEHVRICSAGRSPIGTLDRDFYLFERPLLNLNNMTWIHAINDTARERGLSVMLHGQLGNMSISYAGSELLVELMLAGRWLRLLGSARDLLRTRVMRPTGIAAALIGPFVPPGLWRWAMRTFGNSGRDVRHYTAIGGATLDALDLPARARERGLDLSYRPWRNGFDLRLWVLRRMDSGNYNKGILGGWGIDQRDPTADRRLLEYCLSLPTEQFLLRGMPRSLVRRALADRLPPHVLNERRKGLQAIDWHENLTAARAEVAAEIERLATCHEAAETLDVERMRALVRDWPSGGWHTDAVSQAYRLALLRGVSAGHFLRRTAGGNQ
ncbi:asparagine synthase-related protein [Sphingomonas sp.]|uniref:asparagine synthetase B family protein n=1 Tax=Sphingomonas sp. TaxID=28214 RepID=UPI00307EC8A4